MREELQKIEDEITELTFMQETICKAVYNDDDSMFLYPIAKIIYDRLENLIEKIQEMRKT